MRKAAILLIFGLLTSIGEGQIQRHPTGVNVNASGATTVFITFGNLRDQVPVEAQWCGELTPATPDIGFKCTPETIFGRLPIRYDRSMMSGQGGFTDIMSIPPSVARKAYQAAQRGEVSTFFYVRRFVSLSGGADEYVFVTCRMASGGARVPLALLDVRLGFKEVEGETREAGLVGFVEPGHKPPPIRAEIAYNGTGRLIGRWEVVLPGEDLPQSQDLLTEATLPMELRGTQRRYTELSRFNVFLPPTGRFVLKGPDPSLFPTGVDGLYLILLRIEASDDKEADSSLTQAGAGEGLVHSGGVAGFPIPPLRYYVGAVEQSGVTSAGVFQLLPEDNARLPSSDPVVFSWTETPQAAVYRLEVEDPQGNLLLSAVRRAGVSVYQAPGWLQEKSADGLVRWRVLALGPDGEAVVSTPWRFLQLDSEQP